MSRTDFCSTLPRQSKELSFPTSQDLIRRISVSVDNVMGLLSAQKPGPSVPRFSISTDTPLQQNNMGLADLRRCTVTVQRA